MNHGSHELEPNERAPILVALKDGKLGHKIKESGQSFALSSIFNKDEEFYGEDGGRVYFETAQGNIYLLDYLGGIAQIINANECRALGAIIQGKVSPEILKKQRLTIGEAFSYRGVYDARGVQHRTTTKITKIVATTNRQYNHNDLMTTTGGKSDSIIHDYDRKLSFKPMPFPR